MDSLKNEPAGDTSLKDSLQTTAMSSGEARAIVLHSTPIGIGDEKCHPQGVNLVHKAPVIVKFTIPLSEIYARFPGDHLINRLTPQHDARIDRVDHVQTPQGRPQRRHHHIEEVDDDDDPVVAVATPVENVQVTPASITVGVPAPTAERMEAKREPCPTAVIAAPNETGVPSGSWAGGYLARLKNTYSGHTLTHAISGYACSRVVVALVFSGKAELERSFISKIKELKDDTVHAEFGRAIGPVLKECLCVRPTLETGPVTVIVPSFDNDWYFGRVPDIYPREFTSIQDFVKMHMEDAISAVPSGESSMSVRDTVSRVVRTTRDWLLTRFDGLRVSTVFTDPYTDQVEIVSSGTLQAIEPELSNDGSWYFGLSCVSILAVCAVWHYFDCEDEMVREIDSRVAHPLPKPPAVGEEGDPLDRYARFVEDYTNAQDSTPVAWYGDRGQTIGEPSGRDTAWKDDHSDLTQPETDTHAYVMTPVDEAMLWRFSVYGGRHFILQPDSSLPSGQCVVAGQQIRFQRRGSTLHMEKSGIVDESYNIHKLMLHSAARIWCYTGPYGFVATVETIPLKDTNLEIQVVNITSSGWDWGRYWPLRLLGAKDALKGRSGTIELLNVNCCDHEDCEGYSVVKGDDGNIIIKSFRGGTACTITHAAHDAVVAYVRCYAKAGINAHMLERMVGKVENKTLLLDYYRNCQGLKAADLTCVEHAPVLHGYTTRSLYRAEDPDKYGPKLFPLCQPFLSNYTVPVPGPSNLEQALQMRVQDPQARKDSALKDRPQHTTELFQRTISEFVIALTPGEAFEPFDIAELYLLAKKPAMLRTFEESARYFRDIDVDTDAAPETLKAFMKNEPYQFSPSTDADGNTVQRTGKSRHITTMTVLQYCIMGSLWYHVCLYLYYEGGPFAEAYAFNKAPADIARKLSDIYGGGRTGAMGDFSSWDGHINQDLAALETSVMLACFKGNETIDQATIASLYRNGLYAARTTGYNDVSVLQRSAGKSGRTPTSGMNTLMIAWILTTAVVYAYEKKRIKVTVSDAMKLVNSTAIIGGDDWNMRCPDDITVSEWKEAILYVAKNLGQELDIDTYNGTGPFEFLSRQVWFGHDYVNSCASVPRALGKLHLSDIKPDGSRQEKRQRLVEKCFAYQQTDQFTPGLGDVLRMVMFWVSVNSAINEKLPVGERQTAPRAWLGPIEQRSYWSSLWASDQQWPNMPCDELSALAEGMLEDKLALSCLREWCAKQTAAMAEAQEVTDPVAALKQLEECWDKIIDCPNFTLLGPPSGVKSTDTVAVTDLSTGDVTLLSKHKFEHSVSAIRVPATGQAQWNWRVQDNKSGRITIGEDPIITFGKHIGATGDANARAHRAISAMPCYVHVPTLDETPLDVLEQLAERHFRVSQLSARFCLASWPDSDEMLTAKKLPRGRIYSDVFEHPSDAVKHCTFLVTEYQKSLKTEDPDSESEDEEMDNCGISTQPNSVFGLSSKAPLNRLKGAVEKHRTNPQSSVNPVVKVRNGQKQQNRAHGNQRKSDRAQDNLAKSKQARASRATLPISKHKGGKPIRGKGKTAKGGVKQK